MQFYFIMRVKQNLILNSNLVWKKFSDCSKDSPALGLTTDDAVRVASWLSYDGVTAIAYPEDTMLLNVEKAEEKKIQIPTHGLSRQEFEKKVSDGIYPSFLLRKPANKMEKKMLAKQLSRKASNKPSVNTQVNLEKGRMAKDVNGNKGDENMYYIARLRKGLLLTKTFGWMSVDELRTDKKKKYQLFVVKNDMSVAQTICQWVSPADEYASPCTSITLKRKYSITLPNSCASDSLTEGLRTRCYPAFLKQKPADKRVVAAFQIEVRDGFKDIEARMNKTLNKSESQMSASNRNPDHSKADEEAKVVSELVKKKVDDLVESSVEEQEDSLLAGEIQVSSDSVCRFEHRSASVADSSSLIRSMIESALSFGEMMTDLRNLAAQRKLDLTVIQGELVDLDHMSEFYNLNASDGYRLNKERQEILRKRRTIKDEIFAIELAETYFRDGATPSKIQSFVNSVMGLDHRIYTPRAMTVADVKRIVQNPKTQDIILGVQSSDVSSSK